MSYACVAWYNTIVKVPKSSHNKNLRGKVAAVDMCTLHPCRHVAGADILHVGGVRRCGEGAYMTAKGSL